VPALAGLTASSAARATTNAQATIPFHRVLAERRRGTPGSSRSCLSSRETGDTHPIG
jgi:hypothetical protein